MTQIITTKDLTKNELSGAKILATFAILVGLVAFLNFAQMEQKDLPEIVFTVMPTQVTDGSGLVNFGANISKLANYETKLKVEYTIDNENFQPLNLTQAEIDAGSLTFAPDQEYQISDIVSDSDSVILNFVWDSKAGRQNISSDHVKIRITLAAKLKEADNSDGEIVTLLGEESENVEIDETEVLLEPEVIIQTNEPEPVENNEVNIFEEAINNILEAIIPEAAAQTEAAEEGWAQVIVISEKFSLDNLAPKIQSGVLDITTRLLRITFSESMNTDLVPDITKIVLQNPNDGIKYNIIKGDCSWAAFDLLSLNISLSNIDIAFLTLDEAFQTLLTDTKFTAEPGNNMKDLAGNEVFDALYISEKKDGAESEVKDEEIKKDEEKAEEEEKEEEEEEKVEAIVIPENNKIITTRGYNQNCSFTPDELIMSAGTTGQVELNLIPLDSESKYVLTATTLPNAFDVKILQPSGTGNGPINLEITAPANAAPRLYKLLIKYKDITPQSVNYVNNCVLRLTVQ